MSSSSRRAKEKTLMVVDTPHEPDLDEEKKIEQLHFGFEGVEDYYLSFQEKRTITNEVWFDVNFFKENIPNTTNQFHIWDWDPSTEVPSPYFSKFVREFYASYWAGHDILKLQGIVAEGQPLWAIMKGNISHQDLKFEAGMWLNLVCARLIPSKNTIHVSIEFLLVCCVSGLSALVFGLLEKACREEVVFDFSTRRDKNSLSIKSLLKVSHMAHDRNAQLVKLDKVISFMIQYAIKETMTSMIKKFGNLRARVDIFEIYVAKLREKMDRWNAMVLPIGHDLNLLAVASEPPSMERSPLDD
ncbi:hypothetical protein HAX54_047520 [Datura stramonium]|uniref:Uncharacterized protein n=1 Tax=Datura stramonium TaxID=4076 RepID=A0ABS8WM49_DATST|nr:hypothetical protein [Datura stramonium]